jgi:hypothetical protein
VSLRQCQERRARKPDPKTNESKATPKTTLTWGKKENPPKKQLRQTDKARCRVQNTQKRPLEYQGPRMHFEIICRIGNPICIADPKNRTPSTQCFGQNWKGSPKSGETKSLAGGTSGPYKLRQKIPFAVKARSGTLEVAKPSTSSSHQYQELRLVPPHAFIRIIKSNTCHLMLT